MFSQELKVKPSNTAKKCFSKCTLRQRCQLQCTPPGCSHWSSLSRGPTQVRNKVQFVPNTPPGVIWLTLGRRQRNLKKKMLESILKTGVFSSPIQMGRWFSPLKSRNESKWEIEHPGFVYAQVPQGASFSAAAVTGSLRTCIVQAQ